MQLARTDYILFNRANVLYMDFSEAFDSVSTYNYFYVNLNVMACQEAT